MSTLTNAKIQALVTVLRFPNKIAMTEMLKDIDKAIDNKKAAAVPNLALTVTATPTQAEVQAIATKVDALLTAMRAAGLLA